MARTMAHTLIPRARTLSSRTIDRGSLAAFFGILAGLNAISAPLIESVVKYGILYATVALAGISAGVWFAFAGCYMIAREAGPAEPARRADLLVAAAIGAVTLVPFAELSSLAVLAGGLFHVATSTPGTRTRRIGIVLLAISGTLIWGRAVLALFSPVLLPIDGALVGALAGTDVHGNVVAFTDGRSFVIGRGCSSVHNLTFAVLLWGTLTQLLALPITGRLVLVCLAAMLATAMVNIGRLATIALLPAHFDYLHTGDGGTLFGWASMLVAAVVIGLGTYVEARRPV